MGAGPVTAAAEELMRDRSEKIVKAWLMDIPRGPQGH